MAAASERIRGKVTVDRLSLSRRIHRADVATTDLMRRQITGSIRAGEGVIRIAERLLDLDKPTVNLPQHVEALRDAARHAAETGNEQAYRDAVERYRGRVSKLGQGVSKGAGQFTVRSATQQLVKDLGKAKLEDVDKIVDRWVVERARHQARLVARHETVESFRQVYRENTGAKDYAHGFRWVTSGSHPKPDECDSYAGQDAYGLGPGGYPADALPMTPHPACLCSQVAIIDSQHFKRELAKLQGRDEPSKPWATGKSETPAQWLASKPKAFQQAMLGPTRFKLFTNGRNVLDKTGKPLPVYELLGQPKPRRSLGPAINVTPLIRADRLNQIKPFPKVRPAAR